MGRDSQRLQGKFHFFPKVSIGNRHAEQPGSDAPLGPNASAFPEDLRPKGAAADLLALLVNSRGMADIFEKVKSEDYVSLC